MDGNGNLESVCQGHAGASGRYEHLKEVAVDYAFLIDRLYDQLNNPLEFHITKGI